MAIIHVDKEFDQEVLQAEGKVLVAFWAPWCGPCKMLAPVLEEVDSELDGKVKICKVNVDEASQLAVSYGVMSIPTLILFEGGEIQNRSVGFVTKEKILELAGE